MVTLRRQWVERERLAFRLGCSLPLTIILFNTIAYFQPGFPQLPLHHDNTVELLPGTPSVLLLLYFAVVGCMYLVGTSISFSVWFCYLLTLAESSAVAWTGLRVARPDAFFLDWQSLPWQAYGAYVATVL